MEKSPPKFAGILFKSFLRRDDSDHRLGDLDEVFYYKLSTSSYFSAALWYWGQVVKSIPNLILNEFYWGGTMLTNYVKIALRSLYKSKLYASLNILGLGIAIALSIVGYVNYRFSQSFNSFHINKDKIYAVLSHVEFNNRKIERANVPLPMSQEIKNNIPGIEKTCRILLGNGTATYGDKVFNETFYFVDDDFFSMFTFPPIKGSTDDLKNKNGIIITDEIALKYFGDENPIGKELILSPDGENKYLFAVQAVVAKPPLNSSFSFNFVLTLERIKELRNFELDNWEFWSRATLIQVSDKSSLPKIEKKLNDYLTIANNANENYKLTDFHLLSFQDLANRSRDIGGDPFINGLHPAAIVAPSIMALFVLLLACFNFVNTAIAFASKRLKEIGVRKVMGSLRSQLIKQFLVENLVLCFTGLLVGIFLSYIFVPAYDALWPELKLSINFFEDINLFIFLIGLLVFTGIAAGSYPAFYISKFNPVNILRGNLKFGSKNPLIRVLLTLQFSISIASLIAGIILYQNAEFIKNLDMGFDREQILIIPINSESDYTTLKNSIESNPEIVSIGASQSLMGRSWSSENVEVDNKATEVSCFQIGENYFQTVGFNLVDGRIFKSDLKTDVENSVIVNETFIKTAGWSSFDDKYIKIKSIDNQKEYKIVGVVKDFYPNSVWKKIEPTILLMTPKDNYQFASIKFDKNKLKSVSDFAQAKWKELFPNRPYDGFFANDLIANAVQVTESIKLVFMYVALMVIITTAMGLFALVSLNIAKRNKEIGIRKVLGATMLNISGLLSKEFILLLVISSAIASAMGYYLVNSLLKSIWVYYVDFGVMPFILSAFLMAALSFGAISSQLINISKSNPADAIRDE